ncbi:MAG: hypothetical protein WBD92_07835, partial [Methylovirgula sp.]
PKSSAFKMSIFREMRRRENRASLLFPISRKKTRSADLVLENVLFELKEFGSEWADCIFG